MQIEICCYCCEIFFLLLFLLLISSFFVEKVNSGRGELTGTPGFQAYLSIQSSAACFKLGHQIEIRAQGPISKVLMVFKTVNFHFMVLLQMQSYGI